MKRREALKSASVFLTATTVGLAGCIGGSGGGSTCEEPGETLADSFPDSDDYAINGEVTTVEAAGQEDVEVEGSAFYTGPDGGELVFSLTEYSSEDVASDETDTVDEQGSGFDGAVGYIQTGPYIFAGIGSDEDSVTGLLKASPTLSDGCVDDNIEFV
jgi:hypothetical protein